MKTGMIIKATAGFYYVRPDQGDADVACRARGIFRKDHQTPLVGDKVKFAENQDGSGTVTEILPRKNQLVRPPLANIDHMVIVVSVVDPLPNLMVLDTYIALLEQQIIEPIIAITKSDLQNPRPIADLYRACGFIVLVVNSQTGEGVDELCDLLCGKLSAFCGNSGVGKSSLLNAIDPAFAAPTAQTSKKLGRGKHTTRHVELFKLSCGGLLADTPGFSALDPKLLGDVPTLYLDTCFREFEPFIHLCRFRDCSHSAEYGCEVIAAVSAGKIPMSRYNNYLQLLKETKEVKKWETKSQKPRKDA